jgi:hypothetical protein
MRNLVALSLLLLVTVVEAFGFVPSPVYGSKASRFSGKYVSRKASLTHYVNSRKPDVAAPKMVIY